MTKLLHLPIVVLLALAASNAHAIPIVYSMTGNGFYDNPIGTFTYDVSTNTYSDVDIWSLDHYISANTSSTSERLRATGFLGSVLRLTFSAPLTDAGGHISFSGYEQGVLTLFGRVTRTGTVEGSGASVPEPGAVLLFLLGLAGVWLAPRRLATNTR